MKTLFLFLLTTFLTASLSAQTFATKASGNWNDPNTWAQPGWPGNWFNSSTKIIINHPVTLNVNVSFEGEIKINNNGSLVGTTRNLTANNAGIIDADGLIAVNQLTLNSNSRFYSSDSLYTNGAMSIQNNADFIIDGNANFNTSFTMNGDSAVFNGNVQVGGNFTSSNSSTVIMNGDNLDVDGNLTINTSSLILNDNTNLSTTNLTINSVGYLESDGLIEIDNNFTNNSPSNPGFLNNGGLIVGNNLTNNGGATIVNGPTSAVNVGNNLTNNGTSITFENEVFVGNNLVNNGGSSIFVDDNSVLVVQNDVTNNANITIDGAFAILDGLVNNGGGNFTGDGLLQAESITNWGSIGGNLDVCSADGSDPFGSGSVTGNATVCSNGGANFPIQQIIPLPVILKSFSVTENDEKHALIRWTTATELNNKHYLLYKTVDGNEQQLLTVVHGEAYSNRDKNYQFIDQEVDRGQVYKYTLYQEDYDGTLTKIAQSFFQLSYEVELMSQFSLFPNPLVNNFFTLNNASNQTYICNLRLYDLSGRLLNIIENVNVVPGHNIINFDHKPANGLYFLSIKGVGFKQQIKLVVK